ncbi:MAG: carbon-nitrogen family hydrolase [Verrucomicrobiota bacterium]|nr:carbon-nitrogen family hydrolase [Verrucomicrobiota bacterium]
MRIAAAQIDCVVGDIAANVAKIRSFAEEAKAVGAEWIVFPEMSDTGYVMAVINERAMRWDGGAVPALRTLAKELSLGVICGVSERTNECIFNSQVVIDARGELIGKYRKTHLFSPAPIEENKCFRAGSEATTLRLGDFTAGLSICYDLRFPEFYRRAACQNAANLFIVSSAWPFPRVEHLRVLATARAIENQSYLVLANRVGTDNGVTFCGSSAIIAPSGELLATASTGREELIVADVSEAALRTVREGMPVFEHRRPELYV